MAGTVGVIVIGVHGSVQLGIAISAPRLMEGQGFACNVKQDGAGGGGQVRLNVKLPEAPFKPYTYT
jgi:hypothetical protein